MRPRIPASPRRRAPTRLLTVCALLFSPALRAEEPKGPLADKLKDATFTQYADAPGHSEGPTWRNGEVFFCSGALFRVAEKKAVHKYLELGPAGTVLRADGHLLVADNKYKAVLDVSPDGKVGVIADRWEGQPLRSLNDLTVDARGNVYWTDPEGSTRKTPVGSVFRVRPDGRVDRIATGLAFPNGLDVDPASKFLYVIESQTKKVLRYAKALAGLTALEDLTLDSAQVTDASIDTIGGLRRLRKLNLAGTKITADGKAKLAKLLPRTVVTP